MSNPVVCVACGDVKPKRKGFIIRGLCHACYLERWRQRQIALRAEYICPTCDKSFLPRRSNVRFCCNACRQRAYRANHPRRQAASSPP
jgi:hypothetical protein